MAAEQNPADVYVAAIGEIVRLFVSDQEQLRELWLQEEDNRLTVGIVEGTDWWDDLVRIHRAKKLELGMPGRRKWMK